MVFDCNKAKLISKYWKLYVRALFPSYSTTTQVHTLQITYVDDKFSIYSLLSNQFPLFEEYDIRLKP